MWISMLEKHCHTVTTIVLCCCFFSNLNWFTMPPLMTDSLLIFFLCVFFVFTIFTRHVSKGPQTPAAYFRIACSSWKLIIICHNFNISLNNLTISPLRFNVDIWTRKHQISAASSKDAGDGRNNMRKQYYYIGCYGPQWQWKANIHEKCTKNWLF